MRSLTEQEAIATHFQESARLQAISDLRELIGSAGEKPFNTSALPTSGYSLVAKTRRLELLAGHNEGVFILTISVCQIVDESESFLKEMVADILDGCSFAVGRVDRPYVLGMPVQQIPGVFCRDRGRATPVSSGWIIGIIIP